MELTEDVSGHRVSDPYRWVAQDSFGCRSAAGCRFVERMLTVVQTLRLQKRPVLDYLYRAIVAHRSGLPAPQLLGQGGD